MRLITALSVLAFLLVAHTAAAKEIYDYLLYQVYPRSFKDSNGDGIGDLQGIISKLDHLVDANADVVWVSPINPSPQADFGYDISNFTDIDSIYGNLTDFDDLVKEAHKKDLLVVMDYVPNHTSDQHPWFQKSLKNIAPYNNYYIWHPGKILENGTRVAPNNWVGLLNGKAWTWRDERQAYYLHQFAVEEPDLNYYNEDVVEEMKNVVRFWVRRGVDGLRVDSATFLCEDMRFLDEPLSGITNDPDSSEYTNHMYTMDQPRSYEIIQGWRDAMDESGKHIIMMTEAYTGLKATMKFYFYGPDFPFNFKFVTDVNGTSKAADFKKAIDSWMDNMPAGKIANWVSGNHDKRRITTRFGVKRARAVTLMTLLLPGVGVTYNGEEIGMEDAYISWEENQDPQGCIVGKANYLSQTRDPERTPFQWDDSTAAGFSTTNKTWIKVNENYKTLNLAAEMTDKNSYYYMYKKISALKKSVNFKQANLTTELLSENVFAFARETEQHGSVYIVINFGEEEETVSLSVFHNAPSALNVYYATDGTSLLTETSVTDSKYVKVAGSGFLILITPNAQFGV